MERLYILITMPSLHSCFPFKPDSLSRFIAVVQWQLKSNPISNQDCNVVRKHTP